MSTRDQPPGPLSLLVLRHIIIFIILFLNKIDIFKVKIPKQPLSRYFPEYSGGPDVHKAAKYILWRFMQANRARLSVYPQCVAACSPSANVRSDRGRLA